MRFTFCEDTVSDLHKDAYGFRPAGSFWEFWAEATDTQKQEMWDDLCMAQRDPEAARAAETVRAKASFEALVSKTIADGAKTRQEALRWLMDAGDFEQDWDYMCWSYGVPYGYIKPQDVA